MLPKVKQSKPWCYGLVPLSILGKHTVLALTCILRVAVELRGGEPRSVAMTLKVYSGLSAWLRGEDECSSPVMGCREKRSALRPAQHNMQYRQIISVCDSFVLGKDFVAIIIYLFPIRPPQVYCKWEHRHTWTIKWSLWKNIHAASYARLNVDSIWDFRSSIQKPC